MHYDIVIIYNIAISILNLYLIEKRSHESIYTTDRNEAKRLIVTTVALAKLKIGNYIRSNIEKLFNNTKKILKEINSAL